MNEISWWITNEGLLLVALGCTTVSLLTIRSAKKMRKDANEALRSANEFLEHAVLLDRVLSETCLKAYRRAHLPVWAAWAASMGHYRVDLTVTAQRTEPGEAE